MVNLVHTDGKDYYPVDFRVYAKDRDGKTKNDHFYEMVLNGEQDKNIKANKEEGYLHLDEIEWTQEPLNYGLSIKLKKVPFRVQLFKVVTPNGDIDWIITNSVAPVTTDDVQDAYAKRWHVEQLHHELKQLTGIEKCQCRKQRAQRDHIACCYQAWLAIKVKAHSLGKTLYATVDDLLYEFLRAELRDLRIPALQIV